MDEHRRARLTYGPMAPPPPRNPLATFAFVRTVIIILPRLSKFQTATLHQSSATIGQVTTDTYNAKDHAQVYLGVPQNMIGSRALVSLCHSTALPRNSYGRGNGVFLDRGAHR